MTRTTIISPPRFTSRRSSSGFTLLEVLVVVAILSVIAVAVMQSFNQFAPRMQLRGATEQISRLITKARITAVKRGVVTVVAADYATRSLSAFAELNGDPANPLDPLALYLVYDPTLGVNEDRTDFEIGYLVLPGSDDSGVQFGEPIGGVASPTTIVGFTTVPADPAGPGVLVFEPNGSVRDTGAFRFIDSKLANSLEAALTNMTGTIEMRKYLFAGDAPGPAGYYAEGNKTFGADDTGKNIWVWY